MRFFLILICSILLISCVERKESGIKITTATLIGKEFVPSQEKSGYHYGYSVMKGKYCYHYGTYTESEKYYITLTYTIKNPKSIRDTLNYDNGFMYENIKSTDRILVLYREVYIDSLFDHYQLESILVNKLKINI